MSELLDSEQTLLGLCVLDDAALIQASSLLRPEDFSDPKHGRLFSALQKGKEKGLEGVAVAELFPPNQRKSVRVYLATLIDGLPRSSDVSSWAQIIRRESIRRQAVALLTQYSGILADSDPVEALSEIGKRLAQLQTSGKRVDWLRNEDLVREAYGLIEASLSASEGIVGLSTGLLGLDAKLMGLGPGLYGIGGRPGSGKTALVQQIAKFNALQGRHVGFISMEMTGVKVTRRELGSDARVNLARLYRDFPDDRERNLAELTKAASRAMTPHLHKLEGSFTTAEIEAHTTSAVQQWGIELLALDYAQLIRTPKNLRRHEALAEVSRLLACLAIDLKIPILAALQLNRAPESRSDKAPSLADIAESDAFAKDAHAIALIHQLAPEDPHDPAPLVTLKVVKNREGYAGDVNLRFLKGITKFEDA